MEQDQYFFDCRYGFGFKTALETLEPKLLNYADYLNIYGRKGSYQLFFYEHIKAYTSRSLTLDSDGLNAFEGIIKSEYTKALWGIVSYPSDHSELGFAIGLAWSGVRKPPGGGPIRRREGFPTWSWVSLVDRIDSAVARRYGDSRYCDSMLTGCSAFHVEDEHGQHSRIADVYKRTAGSGALVFSNFGKALFIEANITQVHLLWSKSAGSCSVHAPNSPFRSETGPSSSRLRVKGVRAWIDDEDAELLSNNEHPWNAVQLFWGKGSLSRRFEYWMLVDEREAVAHRIGIIMPSVSEPGEISMEDLETERRLIKIE